MKIYVIHFRRLFKKYINLCMVKKNQNHSIKIVDCGGGGGASTGGGPISHSLDGKDDLMFS